jgi:peptidoglycan/xylan/chitin deacetylase (PgdA/CDA1 family)
MILAATGAMLAGVAATAAYGVAGRKSQLFASSVYRGPGLRKSIALTFDDGPSESTPHLLEYLHSRGVEATFFQCGMNIKRLPAISRDVAAAEHQLGNHSWSHPKLYLKTPSFINREFTRTQDLLFAETGVNVNIFRPPYGFRWFGLRAVQRKLGLQGVLWTVIGHDWEWPAERIVSLVLGDCSPGGIICLHDGRDVQVKPDVSQMMAAVKQIVPVLQDQGYCFETVGQLLQQDSPSTCADIV